MEASLSQVKKTGTLRPLGDLVSLTQVHKVYPTGAAGVHALHAIDLRIAPAEIVTVAGPAGSGKTSLLNVVGLLEMATQGSVMVASLLVSKLSEQARADLRNDLIGFVFQAVSLIPVLNARENVLLPVMLRGRLDHAELAAAHARADSLLHAMGLSAQAGHYPSALSASQCQRVAIARALIGRPRLVIADEPTSRLDSSGVRRTMDLFVREQQAHGTAFLIATCDQRQWGCASRRLQLAEGRLYPAAAASIERPVQVQR